MQCNFQQSIECLARHGVTKTAVWKDKLDDVGVSAALRILNDCDVEVVSIIAGGFFTGATAAERAKAYDRNREMLDQAHRLGAKSMVTITGGLAAHDSDLQTARSRVPEGLAALLPLAEQSGVQLALEPLHPMVCGSRSVLSTLREANDVLDTLGSPAELGIAIDSYALWWEPDLQSEIERAGPRIENLHVSDWLLQTSDTRLDRGMPGDGQINNREIRSWVEATGFNGPAEVEIFSAENWWKKPPDEVVAKIVETSAQHL